MYACMYVYEYLCMHYVIIQIVLEVGVKAVTISDNLLVCQTANLSVSWIVVNL